MYGMASTAGKRTSDDKTLTAELAQISEYKSHMREGFNSVGSIDNKQMTKNQIRAVPFKKLSANQPAVVKQ